MNNIQIFNNPEFGEIRTVTIEGEPWFVGADIAKVLGYRKPTDAVNYNVDEADSKKFGVSDANGHTQQAICINESGMYSLIFGSKLESAKKFKRWVTNEVIPSIRKTGSYLPQTTAGQIQLLAQGHMELEKKIEAVKDEVQETRDGFEKFQEECPMFPIEADKITTAARKKGVSVMGGKSSMAYHDRSIVQLVYRDIYGQIHRNFGCRSYKEIPRKHIDKVLSVIEGYSLPITLSEKIDNANTV